MRRTLPLLVVSVVLCSAQVPLADFYAFGNASGDFVLPPIDDTSVRFQLSFSFPFFGASYDALYVNENGIISFSTRITDFIPICTPLPPAYAMVAPFW